MCLAGLHYFFREGNPSSSQESLGAQNVAEPEKTAASGLGGRKAEQMRPPEARVQSNHKVWASIRLFSRRVAQNLMALVHTGRLRSTVIENFKASLKTGASGTGTVAWQCKVYESCCTLLDIGCKPDVVMRELRDALEPADYKELDENFEAYENALNDKGTKDAVATELLRRAFVGYFSFNLKGELLSSHSALKYMEKLLTHMRKEGVDVYGRGCDAWKNGRSEILTELLQHHISSGCSAERKQGTFTAQDLDKIESVKTRLFSLIIRIENSVCVIKEKSMNNRSENRAAAKKASVPPQSNPASEESEKVSNVRLSSMAEEALKKLTDPEKSESQLVQEVVDMEKLISSDFGKAAMQVVVDNYIDQIFEREDIESYRGLAAVVLLFDNKPKLLDEWGFIRLLSSRIQEKHKEKLNNRPGKLFMSELSQYLI